MSGHSKWSQIKRQKGVTDARRGQAFTKLTREIMVAACDGGSDPDTNYRLRLAVQKAKDQNMPTENIERAIKRTAGKGEGTTLSEIVFEGYGPGGVGLLLETLTDNRNRTLQELRSTLTRGGGSLGTAGCVAWLFETLGLIIVSASGGNAEELALLAIDAGAEDVRIEREYLEIHTKLDELVKVRQWLEDKGLSITSAEISRVPKTTVELDEATTLQVLKLIERLEALDDVQRVFSNVDLPYSVLEKYQFQA